MNKIIETLWPSLLAGILGAVAGYLGAEAFITRRNYIPKIEKVQSGYVVPSKLEIKLQDLDNNGERETLLKYDGKTYLLLYDGNQPRVVPYEVKPAEIVPKE